MGFTPYDWQSLNLGEEGEHENVHALVGGAFEDIDTALTELYVGVFYSRIVYTNKDETFTGKLTIPVTGSVSNNVSVRIIGFKTTPGDMSYGGDYYGGALDALRQDESMTLKNSSADWVEWSGGGTLTDDLILIDGKGCLVFENIWFKNTSGNNNDGIAFANNPTDCAFINCIFDGVYSAISGFAYEVALIDCYFGATRLSTGVSLIFNSGIIDSCVFNGSDRASNPGVCAIIRHDNVINSICYGGTIGFQTSTLLGMGVSNCIFYNQTTTCISMQNGHFITGSSNIFSPAAANDYAIRMEGVAKGSISSTFSHNCVYSVTAASQLTHHCYNTGNTSQDYKLPDSVEENPLFVDVANADFRPRNANVLRGGRPGISGSEGQIGALQQKYQFAQRAGTGNPARLSIFK